MHHDDIAVGGDIHFHHVGADIVAVDNRRHGIAVDQPLHGLADNVGAHLLGIFDTDFDGDDREYRLRR